MILADESKRLTMKFLSTPSGWRATYLFYFCNIFFEFLSTPSGWRATAIALSPYFASLFLSTPSGWRATLRYGVRDKFRRISIHALRVEGDNPSLRAKSERYISIHALRVEGDLRRQLITDYWPISIHALRVEGDELLVSSAAFTGEFLSTPSGWRATPRYPANTARTSNFYPRPPGGGRRRDLSLRCRSRTDFYPRPPGGGRPICSTFATFFSNFYPRPPGGGRPRQRKGEDAMTKISIHALRVEGDSFTAIPNEQSRNFYPRPPGGGRPTTEKSFMSSN